MANASSRALASRCLAETVGVSDSAALAKIASLLTPILLLAGEVLFNQGDVSENLYFIASGRLQVFVDLGTPEARMVGEAVRGETVGEMGLIASLPRSASVRSVRDCELFALSRANVEVLLRAHPEVALALSRQVVLRLARTNRSSVDRKRPAVIAVVGATQDPHAAGVFAVKLAAALERFGSVKVVTEAGAGELGLCDPSQLIAWFDDLEVDNDCVLMCVPNAWTSWGRQCLRHCDEVLWLADGAAESDAAERIASQASDIAPGVTRRIVLVHSADRDIPTGTARWLQAEVDEVTHLREGTPGDIARVARSLAGESVGLVFSGGGARGFAHLGVYQALWEAGVPIDTVGGTSMGAAVGSFVALGLSPEEAIARFKWIFSFRPTGDFNLIPLVSLITGRRLQRGLDRLYRAADGGSLQIEDCWRPFFCMATDFSHSRANTYRRGPISKLVRASMALPGFLPPVFHEGSTLIDGGVFNNLPVDVMRNGPVRHVVAVDLKLETFGPSPEVDLPMAWPTLRNWWSSRGAPAHEQLRIPSMRELLFLVPTLSSGAHQASAALLATVVIRPEVADIGIVDWGAIDKAIERGYAMARQQMEAGAFDALIALASFSGPPRTG